MAKSNGSKKASVKVEDVSSDVVDVVELTTEVTIDDESKNEQVSQVVEEALDKVVDNGDENSDVDSEPVVLVPVTSIEEPAPVVVPVTNKAVSLKTLKSNVPSFGDDSPIYPSEESDRIMWLRERLNLKPGKHYDAEAISAVKTWERAQGYSGMGIVNSERWSELFS